MFKRVATWYIEKFWKEDYVLKRDIGDALLLAKQNEAARLENIFEQQKNELIKQMELDKLLIVEELKAEIVRLNSEMEEMLRRVKDAEAVYFQSVRRAKLNARVTQDMQIQGQQMTELAVKISGAIDGIKERAHEYLSKIDREDKEIRGKLRMRVLDSK